MPETKGKLSRRDRELLDRHKKVAGEYAPGTKFASLWGEERTWAAERLADTIISANILPQPTRPNETPVLVSLSSNVGFKERVLADRLGRSYKVIAGDIANMQRIAPSQAIPVRFDASFLPFRENSIAVMLDLQGAIWYEAYQDLANGNRGDNPKNLLDIFARLRRMLQEEGVIIVDDPASIPEFIAGTGIAKIDPLLRASGKRIEGFDISTIGKGEDRLRVYRKVS